jgi:hypothetical protein
MTMLRVLLIALVALATVGFVVGTSIERHNSGHESAAQLESETHHAEGGETTEGHAHAAPSETHKELRPLGVDIEAVPFVVLAALASLGLAALAWIRPQWLPGLIAIAIAMTVFAALDVREVFHQSDENQTGLAILAGCVAALHLAAAGVALAMAGRSYNLRARTAVP